MEWSIDEWLDISKDARRKYLRRKGLLWDRRFEASGEIVLSSPDEDREEPDEVALVSG